MKKVEYFNNPGPQTQEKLSPEGCVAAIDFQIPMPLISLFAF